MDKKYKFALFNFAAVSGLTFVLIFFGLNLIPGTMLSLSNALLLLAFSMLLGATSSLFHFLKLKTAYFVFNAGILVGLFEMYRSFFSDRGGWEDLAALASLFVWIIIGFCAGVVLQLGQYLYQKITKSNRK